MQELYAEDAVFDVSAVFTDLAPARGHASMRSFWLDLRETWAGLRVDPLEVLDAGNGRYVVDLRLSGTGRKSGLDVGQRMAFLYDIRPQDGKIVHARLFADLPSAIRAAELPLPA